MQIVNPRIQGEVDTDLRSKKEGGNVQNRHIQHIKIVS